MSSRPSPQTPLPSRVIRGQDKALEHLGKLLAAKPLPHALLFFGPEGVGKSLAARETAKALLCVNRHSRESGNPASSVDPRLRPAGVTLNACGTCASCVSADKGLHPDIRIVDAAYQAALREEEVSKQKTLRVDTLRHLRKDMSLNSLLGGLKVAVIADADTMEIEAANAVLKIVEEPPPGTLWILTSSQPGRLPPTIASRCLRIPFSPLSRDLVESLLEEKGVDPIKARELSTLSEGSIGRALALAAADAVLLPSGDNPAALLKAAEQLSSELASCREQVETALWAAGQTLRLRHLEGAPFSRMEKSLRELEGLKRALKSNADPRTIFFLAGEAVEDALR